MLFGYALIVVQRGQKLTITANGTFSKDIEPGATVFLQVKYGLITLIKQEADLCDNLPKIDMSCPIEKGVLSLKKEVDIPRQVVSYRSRDLSGDVINTLGSHLGSTLFSPTSTRSIRKRFHAWRAQSSFPSQDCELEESAGTLGDSISCPGISSMVLTRFDRGSYFAGR
jgi:hypothetical protein